MKVSFPHGVGTRSSNTWRTTFALVLWHLNLKGTNAHPNFIVLQPDDLDFFDEWTPPPHFDAAETVSLFPNGDNLPLLPHLESLRRNSLQMMQAYTASPLCGTSRYSTITGRYPSRSSYGRHFGEVYGDVLRDVEIASTKLQDDIEGVPLSVADPKDCSESNVAAVLSKNGYRTGMVGKWHLHDTRSVSEQGYSYPAMQDAIRSCGFTSVEGVYAENLAKEFWSDGSFSHNMEYLTSKAIKFVDAARDNGNEPFFLYFNPTIPHSSKKHPVPNALQDFSCRDTPEGTLSSEPQVVGMTDNKTCKEYRDTILDRATTFGDPRGHQTLASIWLDDSIGALVSTLEANGQLNNTFFLVQLDHGKEGKRTLYEAGIRIAQFVHYPEAFDPGTQFSGLVSTIDVGPTLIHYAGIAEPYGMDGRSWKDAVGNPAEEELWRTNRCLFFEKGQDRAVRCGCDKYISMEAQGTTYRGSTKYGTAMGNPDVLFNLCDASNPISSSYIDHPGVNQENIDKEIESEPETMQKLKDLKDCHVNKTAPIYEPDYATSCKLDSPSEDHQATL